jgi:uncharacterized membrane protein YGL010W
MDYIPEKFNIYMSFIFIPVIVLTLTHISVMYSSSALKIVSTIADILNFFCVQNTGLTIKILQINKGL